MRIKKRIKTIIIAFLMVAMLCMTVFAAGYQSAQIYYNNIKIVIDGEEITPKDVLGNVVDPFIMNGTTYLPVRAVGEALGMEVEWVGKTYTVLLTTPEVPPEPKPKMTYLGVDLLAYEATNRYFAYYTEKSFTMLGDEYEGCTFRVRMSYDIADRTSTAYYNLKGQYKTIKGTLGHVSETDNSSGMFSIYLDGKLYKEYPITGNMATQDITIDITGVQILQITVSVVEDKGGLTTYGFGNAIIE